MTLVGGVSRKAGPAPVLKPWLPLPLLQVDVGKTLNEKEWIGMCRREVRPLRPVVGGVTGTAARWHDGNRGSAALPVLRRRLEPTTLTTLPCGSPPHHAHLLQHSPTPHCTSPPAQVFDDYLRKRASKLGATLVNGLYMGMETKGDGPITIRYNEYKEGELLGAFVAICPGGCTAGAGPVAARCNEGA